MTGGSTAPGPLVSKSVPDSALSRPAAKAAMPDKRDRPHFSVVIPVYNRAATIRPTLQSLLYQTFSDFEALIVDDGSADGPELERYVLSLVDARFRYLRRSNGGGGAARNTGIDAARGRYVAFLDSDDRFLPDKLKIYAERLRNDPMLVAYSLLLVDRGVGRYWTRPRRAIGSNEDMGEYLFCANQFIQTSTIVIWRDTAARIRFDPQLRKGQDLDFCLRLHASGVRFFMIERPLTVWCDLVEEGRTSRTSGSEVPLAWLERSRPLLTRKAERGWRATVLAYDLAASRPLAALRDLFLGLVLGGVPLTVILRQTMRAFLPRQRYRQLVDYVVARRGEA